MFKTLMNRRKFPSKAKNKAKKELKNFEAHLILFLNKFKI